MAGVSGAVLFGFTPLSAKVFNARYGGDRSAYSQEVLITPYVSVDGRFGISYRPRDWSSLVLSESDLLLGYADSWRAGRFLVDASRHPSIHPAEPGGVSTVELVAQTVKAGADWKDIGGDSVSRLCDDLATNDHMISHSMTRIIGNMVPVAAWCRMWDDLSGYDPSRLEDFAKEYFEECDKHGIEVDAEMIRRINESDAQSFGLGDEGVGSVHFVTLQGVPKDQLDRHREMVARMDHRLGLTSE